MKISRLTFIGFHLNGALGSGKYDDVTIDETKHHIKKNTIFKYLETKLGDDIDMSIIDDAEKEELTREWADMADSIDENRKLCVANNGLCLLVAYIFEGIQRRSRAIKK